MNNTQPVSNRRLALIAVLKSIGEMFLAIFVIGLFIFMYHYYRYIEGLPLFINEVYADYASFF